MQAWIFAQESRLGFVQQLNSEQFFTFIAVMACCVAAAVGLIGYFTMVYLVRKAELHTAMRQSEISADLKSGMIERGFSAEEIERVLAAKESQTAAKPNA